MEALIVQAIEQAITNYEATTTNYWFKVVLEGAKAILNSPAFAKIFAAALDTVLAQIGIDLPALVANKQAAMQAK